MRLFLLLFLSATLLAGCAAPAASRWRQDAFNSFNSAQSAGSRQFAPEETDNIRQTLALADRYFNRELHEDADRLYRLSCQKSRLLYRNLVLSRVRHGTLPAVRDETIRPPDEAAGAADPVFDLDVPDLFEGDQADQDSAADMIVCSATPGVQQLPDTPASSGQDGIFCKKSSDPAMNEPAVTPEAWPLMSPAESVISPAPSSRTAHSVASDLPPAKKRARESGTAPLNDPGRTTIYLTFDDGPSRITLPIAAYLNSQGIPATFFALGNNVKGHEKVVRDTIALGHSVGNHTLSHDLRKLNDSLHQGVNEIEKTAAMLEKLGGDGKMVRIPYGASSKALTSRVAAEGGQIFSWDINSLDSSRRGAKNHTYIERAVKQQLQKNGKRHIIMLFHDGAGHGETLVAIRNLVPQLKQAGYRFGLLSRTDRIAQSGTKGNPKP